MSAAKRYAMAIDTRTCVGCTACVVACRTENDLPEGHTRSWVSQIAAGHLPRSWS